MLSRLEQNVFPWLGATAIDEIEAPDILAVLSKRQLSPIL